MMHVRKVGVSQGRGELILVAEDEPQVRELIVRFLQEAGYRTLAVESGRQALNAWHVWRHDVSALLLDRIMPEMGGREAYESIRAMGGQLPVVFITGYDTEDLQTLLTSEPESTLLEKPFSADQLLSAVQRVAPCRGVACHG